MTGRPRPGQANLPAAAEGAAESALIDHRRFADTLAELARRHGVPGAQLAVHHDGRTLTIEVGELQHGADHQVTRDAAFPIGSVTKTFTASLAMLLVADGDVELDAPLRDQLPELDDLGFKLTLRQLLSHTSGLACGPDSEQVSTASLRRYVVDHCQRRNLILPPGSGFSYSNAGYVLVGRLVEEITGMSWRGAVEEILLPPLGIVAAFVDAAEVQSAGRAIATGHSVNTAVGRTRLVRQSVAPAEAAAGALAVSAADLVGLGLIHVATGVPQLLPPTYAEQMRQPVPVAEPFGLADGWGLGLALFRAGSTNWVGHDGNADGTSCHLRVDPESGWVVAFTSNASTGCGLWQELVDELARAGVPIGRPPDRASWGDATPPPPGCVGTYANGDDEYVLTVEEDGQLRLVVDGDAARLTCYGDTFSVRDPASGRDVFGGRLLRDPTTGEFDGLQVSGRCARRRASSARHVA